METFLKASIFFVLLSVASLATLTTNGCKSDDEIPGDSDGIVDVQPDTTPPVAVTDLRLRTPTQRSLALVWTTPGDDGSNEAVTGYDIRMSNYLITEGNWDDAIPLDSSLIPTPKPAGQIETIVVVGLRAGTRYYFALKSIDEMGNESGISNCASEQTLGEAIPPSDVSDLTARTIDESSYELTWTAPGDDGMSGIAAQYDIRYSIRPITDEAGWDYATQMDDPISPKPAGQQESVTLTGLSGLYYFFALKTADDLDNWSGLSNQAPAIKSGEVFFVTPAAVATGEYMYILFRSSTTDYTRVSLHGWAYDKYCGNRVIEDIVWETLPGGVHMVTYDFFDHGTGGYVEPGYYWMSLCWGTELQKWMPAILEE